MSEFSSGYRKIYRKVGAKPMRCVTEACEILNLVAGERYPRESYKAMLVRVTTFVNKTGAKLGLLDETIKYSRIDDIWSARIKYLYAHEMDALRAARDAIALGAAKHEHKTVLDRLAALETRLRVADEDFHRPDADGLRRLARDIGGEDRTGDLKGGM
jgi:hypothetical protein